MEQAINYYNQMDNLRKQGVPISWDQVAAQMAAMLINAQNMANQAE
jgi:hypothetical protein